PMVAWHPSGQVLSYFYENEGETWLVIYSVDDDEKVVKPVYNFIKILDYAYAPDGKTFVMSAVQNGQTDIFIYSIAGGGATPVTKDIYDDLSPRFVNNGRNIVFSSNRPNDTLGKVSPDATLIPSFDLFSYNWQTKSRVLRRVTNTPFANEFQVQPWDSTHFTYISDQNGIYNRFVGYFDSTIAYIDTAEHYRFFARSIPVTNYKFNIIEQDISPSANQLTEVIFHDGRYFIYIQPLVPFASLTSANLKNTAHRDRVIELARIDAEIDSLEKIQPKTSPPPGKPMQTVKVPETPEKKTDSTKIDINNYQFDGNKPKTYPATVPPPPGTVTKTGSDAVPPPPDTLLANTTPKDKFLLPIQRNYKIQFSTEYVVSQLDNSFLNAGYQRFSGGSSPIYLNPGFTGLMKIGMSDLLEDHKIVGAVRLSGDLKNNEYVLYFEDRTRRWDKSLMLHRQAFLNVSGFNTLSKMHTHEARYGLKYPFTEVLSFRGIIGYRNDRRVFLATDYNNLLAKNQFINSANAKVELVFDNTIRRGLNLYNGMRFKFFVETFQGLDSIFQAQDKSNRWFKNDLYAIGLDFRYYMKIHREIIWAFRATGATSFGNEKLVYYLGGVDNWLRPKFDRTVNVSQTENYTYQTLATPMRGFWQNIRNGNSVALINNEVRVPLFRYLFNRPLRQDFFNHFQVVGFTDVGTAWTGP
ncbi:MAG TPA: hypothetical protein VI731_08325, partial [Bacteroidia bacterium]|nr:hypothetical protein [Bacteroidia bacterium]